MGGDVETLEKEKKNGSSFKSEQLQSQKTLNYQQQGQKDLSLSSWCWLLKMPSNHADQLQVGKQPAQARKQVNNRSLTHSNKTQEHDRVNLANKWDCSTYMGQCTIHSPQVKWKELTHL